MAGSAPGAQASPIDAQAHHEGSKSDTLGKLLERPQMVEISGEANAQLGDRFTTIQTANFFIYANDPSKTWQQNMEEVLANVGKKQKGHSSQVTDEQRPDVPGNPNAAEIVAALVGPNASNTMLERVDCLGQKAFLEGVDERISEQLDQWWSFETIPFMCIETPLENGDERSALASAKFFCQAKEPKFIYLRDRSPRMTGETICTDMIDSLIQQQMSYLASCGRTGEIPAVKLAASEHALSTKVEVFKHLCLLVLSGKENVLLIFEGIEPIEWASDYVKCYNQLLTKALKDVNAEAGPYESRVRCVFIGPGCGQYFDYADSEVRFFDAMDAT